MMEKLIYVEPVVECIEIEVEDIMTESGLWTDPFSLDQYFTKLGVG